MSTHFDKLPTVPLELLPQLQTKTFGRDYHYLESTISTNVALAKLATAGAAQGTLVLAQQQQAGRGRMGRGWFSPPHAGLYFSILFRPMVDVAQSATLPLVIGLAVADALTPHLPDHEPQVKWPNDVWIDGHKICGILCELKSQPAGRHCVIAGIGINVNLEAAMLPIELKSIATSLKMITGRTFCRTTLLAALLAGLERDYALWQAEGWRAFIERFHVRDALWGRAITVARANDTRAGIAEGTNEDGSLRLRLANGSVASIYSGDAHLVL